MKIKKHIGFYVVFYVVLSFAAVDVYASDFVEIVVRGASIPAIKPSGSSWDTGVGQHPDPYIIVYVNDVPSLKTSVKQDSLEPKWNARLQFSSDFRDDQIRVELYDADIDWGKFVLQLKNIDLSGNLKAVQQLISGDDLIAEARFNLSDQHFVEDTPVDIWMIRNESKGIFILIRPIK